MTANDIQTFLQKACRIHVSVKAVSQIGGKVTKIGQCDENGECKLIFDDTVYMRISAWTHNTEDDFRALHNQLHNNLSLKYTTSAQLKAQYLEIWSLYDKEFSVLKPVALFERGERLRHHLIFYLGHTATFFINKLVTGKFLD